MRKWIMMLAFAVAVGVPLSAQAGGTADQAKALVEKAAALLQAEGPDKAFAAFDDPHGAFVNGDLYIFVNKLDGTTVAHGTNPKLIGKNLINVKDADGKYFVKDITSLAETKGEGWVDYKWSDPITHKIEPKSSFVKKVGDYVVGCGIYKS